MAWHTPRHVEDEFTKAFWHQMPPVTRMSDTCDIAHQKTLEHPATKFGPIAFRNTETSLEICLVGAIKISALRATHAQYTHDTPLVHEVEPHGLRKIGMMRDMVNIIFSRLARTRLIMRNTIRLAPMGDFFSRNRVSRLVVWIHVFWDAIHAKDWREIMPNNLEPTMQLKDKN